MKIALDNRALKFSGIGVYTNNLYTKLHEIGINVVMYNDGLLIDRNKFYDKYIKFIKRLFRENICLNNWLKDNKVTLYHVTKNTGIPILLDVPVIVTIHDIIPHIFPKYYLKNYLEKFYYEIAIKIAILKSKKIITISNFSKSELIKYYKVNPEKIAVIPLAYNKSFHVINNKNFLNKVKIAYNLNYKYILAIGGSEYRKNIERLIKVFLNEFSEKYNLVIIGGKWRDIDLSKKYKSKNIIFLSNVPEKDLVAIYNMAEVFVFPSFYEGFGIPVLEGMACGIPVITSNISSMPEVGGEAAIYFDPFDEIDMAEKISLVLDNEYLKKIMVIKGLEKVKEYSWEKCVYHTLKIYKECL